MKAVAAARIWWAAVRRRSREPSGGSVLHAAASHLSSYALMILAVAMLACAVAGFSVTLHEDSRQAAERHAALQLALDEFYAASGRAEHFDGSQIAFIARRAGLQDLRFDTDDGATAGREVQSVHDAQGRILGWFSWAPDRSLIRALIWLWGFTGGFGAALGLCAFFAAGLIQRLAHSLAVNLRTIRKLTSEDELTGLPNHRVMLERLTAALDARRFGIVVLALIDVDGFRDVNDTHGRGGGDALMKSIAERLRSALPAGALLGRFEDDDFAVVMGSDDILSAAALAQSLRTALSRPIFMEQNWQISAGIGIAEAPGDGKTAEELSRRADLALRAGKHEGRGVVKRFEPHIEIEYTEQRFIRRELEAAIESQSFDVHYQPIVAAAGGSVLGVEALLRWTHPTRGVITPSVFIPLAEKSGLMLKLGEFVLRRALADAARWPNLTVAINLSPLQIREPRVVDVIGDVIKATGVAASRIVFEVTESVLIDDPQATLKQLEALRGLGVGIALDDFGTGYSSLSYLQKFPFSKLKIDRAFVASLGATGSAGAIIQSMVTLGHALGMKVIAEGVETDEQRVLLRLAGCDQMQGFLFAKPRPAAAIDKLVARSSAAASATKPAAAR
jgi:diguanylate cyclase (GGDEF)-like protein